MITGIVIENFKGIRERVEIELRPLTLLFGANSGGKSTIVDALSLFEQLLLDRHHRRGVSLTRRMGERVGSIQEVTHEQQPGVAMTLGVTISVDEDGYDYFGALAVNETGFQDDNSLASSEMPSMSDMCLGGEDASRLSVEITVAESIGLFDGTLSASAQIMRLVIGINGRQLASLDRTPKRGGRLNTISWKVDTEHPILSDDVTRDGLRSFNVDMPQILPLDNEPPILRNFCDDLDDGPLAISLNLAVITTLRAVEDELSRHRRLGPLRQIPPRGFRPQPHPAREDWLTGLAAWDQLGFLTDDELYRVNHWLGLENLDAGTEVRQKIMVPLDEVEALWQLKDTDPALFASNLFRLQCSSPREVCLRPIGTKYGGSIESDANLSPSQVGTGVSQLVPIVVACMSRERWLVTIAQPELHLHPRLQVKLGDLFIDCVTEQEDDDKPNRMIVETHSEHLILRLLRRIRETTKGCAPDGQELSNGDLMVYHVSQEEGATRIRKREVDANGQFVIPWPDDFFEIDFYERFDDAR